jgi:hypothetical protein
MRRFVALVAAAGILAGAVAASVSTTHDITRLRTVATTHDITGLPR